jgi:hypothetical protein
MSWAVVVPSNRPDRLADFRKNWGPTFTDAGAQLYVVEDADPWPGIPAWVPRRTDMIRSWGFVQAFRDGHDYVLSLDDDVLPYSKATHLLAEYEAVFQSTMPVVPCLSVGALTGTGLEMRGYPDVGRERPVAIQYGGWKGVPDLDGRNQLLYPATRSSAFMPAVMPVPRDIAVTTCAMNFAVRRTELMWCWQLPMTADGLFNRWGDIWSGLIQKRMCDITGRAMVVNGRASVRHHRASDPQTNADREAPGYASHDGLWEAVRRSGQSFVEVSNALADHVLRYHDHKLARDAVRQWRDHFLWCRDLWISALGERP